MKKNRYILILFLLVCILEKGECQIFNGFWQENTNVVGSAMCGGYYFEGNKFEYNINQYDGLNPIRIIGGTYHIIDDSITLNVYYYFIEEQWDGIDRDMFQLLNDTWALNGGNLCEKKLLKVKTFKEKIFITNDIISIGERKYYKTGEKWQLEKKE
jgi:hypothetical protein